mgnify:CR=1 FL=1
MDRFDGKYKLKHRIRGGNGQCAGVQGRKLKVSQRKVSGELFHWLAEIIPITGTVSPNGETRVQGENA